MPAPLVGFFLLFVAGALLRAGGLLHRTHAERLATIVFSVSLPATILVSLDRITLSPSFWRLPLAAWFVVLPMLLGAWLIGRRLDLTKAAQGSFILATTIMNMAFFAYPLILATMGEQGFVRALLFDLGHGLLVFTVVYGVAVRHGERTAGGRSASSASCPPRRSGRSSRCWGSSLREQASPR
jgi:predicted permease